MPDDNDKIFQFLVRFYGGKTLVLFGKPQHTISSILYKIQSLAYIPVPHLRLVYENKQLEPNGTLSQYNIPNGSELKLLYRNRSCCWDPVATQLLHDLVSNIRILCTHSVCEMVDLSFIITKVTDFLNMVNRNDVDFAAMLAGTFTTCRVSEALVKLYMSPYKKCAHQAVNMFVDAVTRFLLNSIMLLFVPMVLELCTLLREAASSYDHLYQRCRSRLALRINHENEAFIALEDMFPFLSELAQQISQAFASPTVSTIYFGDMSTNGYDFIVFMRPLKASIKNYVNLPIPISTYKHAPKTNKIKFLYVIFDDLFTKLLLCLDTMKDFVKEKKENVGWNQLFIIMRELYEISKLYEGAADFFWTKLRDKKLSLSTLIVRYATRGVDYGWICEHKDVINFEARRHLVMLLLPEVKDEYDDLHEMLVDRSQLLAESFEYIEHVEPEFLRDGIYMEFKNEDATGPGVLREWFFMVCQEIFNPKTGLFVACPNDCRRFFPNPASKVDPLHLEYFNFVGRVIALALMRNIQVGIAFDRSFFSQLAGKNVSLEDIKDADPYFYSSCHHILNMDPMVVDQDALGLTFVWNIEEYGSIKVAELCPGGKNIIVNSINRKEYVDLLIHLRFVTSVSEQITHFVQGFSEIVGEERIPKMCFRSLELEDFDGMLHGSEKDISVQDWKKHTDYHGYKETDPQILWFWKIVDKMTAKQRMLLVFFWTSMKYLPLEGFGGLGSRLYIYRSNETVYRLPSSHTCFYQICLPAYPSMSVMEDRLNIITQDHVGYSFGTY